MSASELSRLEVRHRFSGASCRVGKRGGGAGGEIRSVLKCESSSNQKAINAVLVAFVTISLVVLLVILIVVCRLLPKKETALTQPLLDEENS